MLKKQVFSDRDVINGSDVAELITLFGRFRHHHAQDGELSGIGIRCLREIGNSISNRNRTVSVEAQQVVVRRAAHPSSRSSVQIHPFHALVGTD